MTITLKEDVAYILLKKIGDRPEAENKKPLNLNATDFVGRETNHVEVLAHLDYLNQKGYINANFSGDAYAAAGPNPLPETIEIESAQLTENGKELLDKMNQKLPQSLESGPSVQIASKDMDFLKKVMLKGNINSIYDARDATELVFRTMRDLMTNEASDRVSGELSQTTAVNTSKERLPDEVANLWEDTNPLVHFLSKIRPPLKLDADTFLFRIQKEGGVPKGTGPKTVLNAVFGATKDELSEERIKEIAEFMPGEIKQMWEEA